jgi:hypothetical protein
MPSAGRNETIAVCTGKMGRQRNGSSASAITASNTPGDMNCSVGWKEKTDGFRD